MRRNDAQHRLGGHTGLGPDHQDNKNIKMQSEFQPDGEIRLGQMGRVTVHLKPSPEHLCSAVSPSIPQCSNLEPDLNTQPSTNHPIVWV